MPIDNINFTFKTFPLKRSFCFLTGIPQVSSIIRFNDETSCPSAILIFSTAFPFHFMLTCTN